MSDRTIIVIAWFSMYYILGGLATTNMLRLTKGSTLSVNSSKCVCESCGAKIPPLLQLPIISYIVCRGKCRDCGAAIPIYPLILEISVWVGMCAATSMLGFSLIGAAASFAYYEVIRLIVIAVKGRRNGDFIKQYVIAVLSMLPFLACSLFISQLFLMV